MHVPNVHLYRGEPVPSYWGSPDYPDRYLDGGRWGPPYALIQGGLLSNDDNDIQVPPAESTSTPIITRGMVAWAGGKGGPHFFIALADHPEWNHEHTVWGEVVKEQDMQILNALLSRPLVTTTTKTITRRVQFCHAHSLYDTNGSIQMIVLNVRYAAMLLSSKYKRSR